MIGGGRFVVAWDRAGSADHDDSQFCADTKVLSSAVSGCPTWNTSVPSSPYALVGGATTLVVPTAVTGLNPWLAVALGALAIVFLVRGLVRDNHSMIRPNESMPAPTPLASDEPCPCGGGEPYGSCCELLHLGGAATTAEHLMRSRYSAFCLGQVEYLLATHHPSQRQPDDRVDLLQTLARTSWIRLQILTTQRGTAADDSGQVEFVATYREDGTAKRLHERSGFVKENGRWFYLSGAYENLAPPPKPGRNEPCWCGSGKKYKKCHLGR